MLLSSHGIKATKRGEGTMFSCASPWHPSMEVKLDSNRSGCLFQANQIGSTSYVTQFCKLRAYLSQG